MFSANASQVSNDVKYIEDFCSVYLRTGTGSSQTVTTGVKENTGALVISKSRSAATDWAWYDTFRGATKELASNTTAAEITQSQGLTSFNTDGHTWGTLAKVNTSGATYVDFVLKPTPKFFDVVTFTTNSSGNATVSHALGSTPGFVITKSTSASDWYCWHRSLPSTNYALRLQTTDGQIDFGVSWITPSSTTVQFTNSALAANQTYVMYVFAHNAGGFGLTGTDNVISCGSYTGTGGALSVTLGYEPQLIIAKPSSTTGDWQLIDTMRGWTADGVCQRLEPNTSDAEATSGVGLLFPTATGFGSSTNSSAVNTSGQTYIYIAIRRGPMKVPTTGTSVFGLSARSGTGANATVTGGAGVTDLAIIKNRGSTPVWLWVPRLAGTRYMSSNQADVEIAAGTTILQANPWDVMDGVKVGTTSTITNASSNTFINYLIDRAPGFMDVVCDTGTGSTHTIAHNLTVIPEFYIRKDRTGGGSNWVCYHKDLGATQAINLNQTVAAYTLSTVWNNTAPTTSVFTVGTNIAVNSGVDYVTYLFASAPGVSKVGSYTGTGTTQQINCGFTAGSRFVLIKRTDSTGDWYVWDSARGIVAGNDPYLLLNSTAAEVTSTDYIDPVSSGFEISSTAPAAINASGGTFIFLAIA